MSQRSGSFSKNKPATYQGYKPSYQPVNHAKSATSKSYNTTKKCNLKLQIKLILIIILNFR